MALEAAPFSDMAPDKRNQFLDAEESDDEGSQGYDSEADELQKGGELIQKTNKMMI